ncbi:MAG: hypothetical protein C4536_15090, partial [Actinobacteria bacterium]
MRRLLKMLTKTGCGKPATLPFAVALISSLFALVAVGSAMSASPAWAQAAGDGADGETVAVPAAPLAYAPGEVLVKFADPAAAERIVGFLDVLGLESAAREVFEEGGELLAQLDLAAGVQVEDAVRLLQSLAGVVYAEPNYVYRADYAPADPSYPQQWGLNNTGQNGGTPGDDIGAQEAWDIERGDTTPVTVAVIDSGIDFLHPDLDGKIWDNGDEVPGNGLDDDGNGYVDDAAGYNWAGITQSRYYYYDYGDETYYTTARYFGSGSANSKRAQSIKGTGQRLTHVGFALQKVDDGMAPPPGNITVSLRSDRDGAVLASFTINAAEVGPLAAEIYKSLSTAVTLTSGETYYLVLETAASASDYYYLYDNWGTSDPDTDQFDPYQDGQESRWDGTAWVDLGYENDDLYFRTNANANPRDDNGHGTHVSGIAGAEEGNGQGGVGVSFGAEIMPLKVMDSTGRGYNSDITAGIRYAADNGAQVINLSLGGTSYSASMRDAVDYAHAAGVVVVASAGNSGDGTMQYPAGYDNVIAVGATDRSDVIASFSTHNSSVDLSAPGVAIHSTMPTYEVGLNSYGYGLNYANLNGTSMAAPMASGVAALLRSYRPTFTPGEVASYMQTYAHDLGAPGWDEYFGYGRIDAYASLDAIPPVPHIDGIAPGSGEVGSEVTVGGSAFGSTRGTSYVS